MAYFNNNLCLTKPIINTKMYGYIINNNFNRLVVLLQNMLYSNNNVLFVDFNLNFNYLPITNKTLFSRSSRNLSKLLKYFNISVICFINLNKKKFIFKKLISSKTINISIDSKTFLKKFDLNLSLPQNKLTNYILYLVIMSIYLGVKNKNLKTNGSTLFFF